MDNENESQLQTNVRGLFGIARRRGGWRPFEISRGRGKAVRVAGTVEDNKDSGRDETVGMIQELVLGSHIRESLLVIHRYYDCISL